MHQAKSVHCLKLLQNTTANQAHQASTLFPSHFETKRYVCIKPYFYMRYLYVQVARTETTFALDALDRFDTLPHMGLQDRSHTVPRGDNIEEVTCALLMIII